MKLLMSDALRRIAELGFLRLKGRDRKHYQALSSEGYVVIPDFISCDRAETILSAVYRLHGEMKNKISDDNQDGSDRRFYGIDRFSQEFDFFINSPIFDQISAAVHGYRSKSKFLLSNVLCPNKDNLGSGGGWHRDSPYSHQFKTFLFLTDVGMDNGPLSYIKGSHQRKNIEAFAKCVGKSTDQYRFTDEEVEKAVGELGLQPEFLTCSAGTLVMADTRGLHRGIPILEGTRVALTSYYFKGAIPERFGVEQG